MKSKRIIFVVIALAACSLAFAQLVVNTLNGLSGNVNIAAGSGISVSNSGQTITVASTVQQPNSPVIVFRQTFIVDSSPGSPLTVNLLTPSTDGDFRISISDLCPQSQCASGLSLTWQSDGGLTGFTFSPQSLGDEVYLHAINGTPITFTSTSSSVNFPIRITVEKL
jgi:hypothetical protein